MYEWSRILKRSIIYAIVTALGFSSLYLLDHLIVYPNLPSYFFTLPSSYYANFVSRVDSTNLWLFMFRLFLYNLQYRTSIFLINLPIITAFTIIIYLLWDKVHHRTYNLRRFVISVAYGIAFSISYYVVLILNESTIDLFIAINVISNLFSKYYGANYGCGPLNQNRCVWIVPTWVKDMTYVIFALLRIPVNILILFPIFTLILYVYGIYQKNTKQ